MIGGLSYPNVYMALCSGSWPFPLHSGTVVPLWTRVSAGPEGIRVSEKHRGPTLIWKDDETEKENEEEK